MANGRFREMVVMKCMIQFKKIRPMLRYVGKTWMCAVLGHRPSGFTLIELLVAMRPAMNCAGHIYASPAESQGN